MKENKNGQPYKIIEEGGWAEIVEKKSKFIATIQSVQSEEEAISFLEEIKKKYWDASHNCYAYVIGKDAEIVRCSDAGEPSQTAGRPMLEVLLGEEIRNVLVVVTRYFGGTLLGTGGLVRAYSQAVKEALEGSKIAWMRYGVELELSVEYNDLSKIQYVLLKKGIIIQNSQYTQSVSFVIQIPVEQFDILQRELLDLTGARVKITERKRAFYVDKQVLV